MPVDDGDIRKLQNQVKELEQKVDQMHKGNDLRFIGNLELRLDRYIKNLIKRATEK